MLKVNKGSKTKKNTLKVVKFEIKKCDDKLDISSATKIKLTDVGQLAELAKLGIETAGNIASKGGSGLYYVNTYGGKLCFSAMKNANIGATFLKNGDLAQAALTQVVFNPLTLCSSISNITLQIKLDEINKKLDKVVKCFEDSDKAKLKVGFKKLVGIMQKFEDRKENKRLIDSDINRVYKYLDDADEIKTKYFDKIYEIIGNPSKWSNKKAYNEIKKYYNIVSRAMYLKGLATYVVTVLEGKFDKKYLDSVKSDLTNDFDEIVDLYNECTDFITEHIDKDWYEKFVDFIDATTEIIKNPLIPLSLTWKITGFAVGKIHRKIKKSDKDKY